jgi:hypothetical protein
MGEDMPCWWRNLKESDHFEDLGIDRRLLKWILRNLNGGVEWIVLAQDRDKWRTVVNTVMDIEVS